MDQKYEDALKYAGSTELFLIQYCFRPEFFFKDEEGSELVGAQEFFCAVNEALSDSYNLPVSVNDLIINQVNNPEEGLLGSYKKTLVQLASGTLALLDGLVEDIRYEELSTSEFFKDLSLVIPRLQLKAQVAALILQDLTMLDIFTEGKASEEVKDEIRSCLKVLIEACYALSGRLLFSLAVNGVPETERELFCKLAEISAYPTYSVQPYSSVSEMLDTLTEEINTLQ